MKVQKGTKGTAGEEKTSADIVYTYKNALYVNLTSRCPTACRFCIKFSWDYRYRGFNLKLPADPAVKEVVEKAGDVSRFNEVVFCGYGESTYRLDAMAELSRRFRAGGARRIRLNTIGLGNLINGRDISGDLEKIVDAISVSLNTADPAQYEEIHRPLPEFRNKGLSAVGEFARACHTRGIATTLTAVSLPGVDISAVEKLAVTWGVPFRLRPHLDEYEAQ